MSAVVERFLRYVKCNTQSDPDTGMVPSTPGQVMFAEMLCEEMKVLGMSGTEVDGNGYVYGFLPSNVEKEVTAVGFISHMDTSPDMSGKHVRPQIIQNYAGTDIVLDKESNLVLSPEQSPELLNYIGQDLITTSGNSLLGADDKAGIAEILTAVEYLVNHPEVKHGEIYVCFTPDEEIGHGTDHFDLKKFRAKFAYTLDGGEIGELQYENFNAAFARLTFKGKSFHPGYAKNKMVNSIAIANDFLSSMPKKEVPENTLGYEGYFHVSAIRGDVEETVVDILIRDFDREGFAWRKNTIENGVRDFSRKYGLNIELELKDQYYNMREKIEPVRYVVDIARLAMTDVGVKPLVLPVRGGTDGAQLSYMGLPAPNLFTGAHNLHGRYEYIPVNSMEKAVEVVVRIAELCMNV